MSDDSNALTALIAGGAALATGALSSLLTFLAARRPGKAAEVTAEAAFQAQLTAGFEKLTAQYDNRNRELVAHVLKLENAVIGLSNHLLDLEDTLRKLGHPIPERPPAAQWPPPDFHVIQGGKP